MSQDKENIQARLAEYVEGTLDAAGRAEIERHLQANPEHRQLMADLIEAKTTLANLPRERAPADLVEMLQGQLERAVLLEGDLTETSRPLRLRRWPQALAVAAILALAIGLGLVVYVTLPPQHPSGFTIVEREVPMLGVAPPDALVDAAQPAPTPATGGDGPTETRVAAAPPSPQPPAAPVMTQAVPQRLAQTPAPAQPAPLPLPLASLMPFGIGQRLAESIAPKDEVVIVMAGADPHVADDRVVALFLQQNVQWERIGQPAMVVSSVADRSAVAPAVSDNARGIEADATAARPEQEPVTRSRAAGESAVGEAPAADALAVQAAKEPSNQAATPPPALVQAQNGYLVRGLTRQQAAELLQSLSSEGSLQMQQVYNWYGDALVATNAMPPDQLEMGRLLQEDARRQTEPREAERLESEIAPQRQPTADNQQAEMAQQLKRTDGPTAPIAAGETIEIVVDELVGPGVTPAVQQQVDARGRVKLQMIPDPVQAEGLTPAELEQQIAAQYRDLALIDAPTVRVRRLSDAAVAEGQDRVNLFIVVQNPPAPPAADAVTDQQPPADAQPVPEP